jgi:hypothetical protein
VTQQTPYPSFLRTDSSSGVTASIVAKRQPLEALTVPGSSCPPSTVAIGVS